MSNKQSSSYGGTSKLSPASSGQLTYNTYLKVAELKSLQECQSNPPHHDELLFIIIQQAYELWFKLILHELDAVMDLLSQDDVHRAVAYMNRVNNILKLLVQQIHILETMTPKGFLGFRNKLNTASGFQSSQFRELEFVAGLPDKNVLDFFESDSTAYKELLKRYESATLKDSFYALLKRKGLELPEPPPGAGEELVCEAEEIRLTSLLRIYQDEDAFGSIFDLAECFVEFDEQLFFWRAHHAVMAERMIGFKMGTGGSDGVGYLRSTFSKRCFEDLWKLRTNIV